MDIIYLHFHSEDIFSIWWDLINGKLSYWSSTSLLKSHIVYIFYCHTSYHRKTKHLFFPLCLQAYFIWHLTFPQKATIRFKENSLNLNFFRLMIKFCTWRFVTFWALRHGHLKTLGGDIINRHSGTGSMSQDKFTKCCIWTSARPKKNAVTWSSHQKKCTYKNHIRIMLLH